MVGRVRVALALLIGGSSRADETDNGPIRGPDALLEAAVDQQRDRVVAAAGGDNVSG